MADSAHEDTSLNIGLNFTGSTLFTDSSFIPPDTMGGVGSDHIVELINGRYSVYDITDGERIQTSSLDQFWIDAGVSPSGSFAFDPRVAFDPFSERWYALSVDNAGDDNNFLFAVSDTSDPTQGWEGFAIDSDSTDQRWADFPMLGFDEEGVYLSANMFPQADSNVTSVLTTIVVLPKDDLLAPNPTVSGATLFENNDPNTTGFTPRATIDLDNSQLPALLFSDFNTPEGFFKRSTIEGNVDEPILNTDGGFISVNPFNFPQDAEQPGPKTNIDTSDNRFSSDLVLQDDSVWGVQTVNNGGRAALRWFEIDADTNNLLQEGLIADSELEFYYGSIAVNEFDDVVIGFSGSSENQFVSTYAVQGETNNDVTNFGEPLLLKEGVADYEVLDGIGRNRWGDYSATVVDPEDPLTFWTFQEFVSGEDVWSTQITELKINGGDEDLEEPNDTIPQAVEIELERTFEASSLIGNNPNVTPTDDVDLISFQLDAGDRVTIDIDAQVLGSSLDSVLRLFDSEGNQVAVNDDSGGSLDSFINFTALASDTYFAGVSSFANFNYDPFLEGSGSGGSTGEYDITVNLFPGEGDGELENGSFETGTFSDWRTIGDTSIKSADFGVTPTDGSFQALLTNGVSDSGGSVVDSDLEAFLNLAPGVLDGLGNGDVTEGSAIKQTFTANAGDILTFDWNFLTNEETPEASFNDFAFFSLTPFTLELADTTEPTFFETLTVDFDEETGFQTATVAISESGTYTLGLGVSDVGDDVVDSGLLVDNVQLVSSENGGEQVFEDPSGDTFGSGFPQLDIENVSGVVSGGELTLTMDFFTPIAAPSTGLAESVGGFWDLDLDQNPSTGIASNQSIFAPPDQQGGPLGVDVFIDLFSEQFQPGFVDLVDANFSIIGSAPISYGSDSLEIEIPLSLLGDDGNLNYGTVIGTFGEPTDAAPNDEFGIVGASLSSSLDTNTPVSNRDRIWRSLSQTEEFESKALFQLSPSMDIGTRDFAKEDLLAMEDPLAIEDPLQLSPSMGIGTGL